MELSKLGFIELDFNLNNTINNFSTKYFVVEKSENLMLTGSLS